MKILKIIWTALKKGWMKFANILGRINTTILLSILYFIVVGIYSIFAGLLRVFRLIFRKNTETYWISRTEEFDPQSCKHPF